jgi:Ca2+-binding RTX toxin-like protein
MIITGTAGADTLLGTVEDDTIYGLAGNDTITGRGGFDRIYDGAGSDTVIMQGSGILYADVTDSTGNDIYRFEPAAGVTGAVATINYAEAFDSMSINLETGIATYGTIGTDTLTGFTSAIGGHQGDVMSAASIGSSLWGMDGDDQLIGAAGNDDLYGGGGGDWLSGGKGSDRLDGGDGGDRIFGDEFYLPTGEDQANWISGGNGNDYIVSSANGDWINAGAGDDNVDCYGIAGIRIFDGAGADVIWLWGGGATVYADCTDPAANDIYRVGYYNPATSQPYYGSTISYAAAQHALTADLSWGRVQGADIGTDQAGLFKVFIGGQAGDQILASGYGDTICGSGGGDTITGYYLDDTLRGGDGNDFLTALYGTDTLYGDAGNDILLGGESRSRMLGGAGDDRIVGSSQTSTIWDGAGNDIVRMGQGGGTIYADTTDAMGNDYYTKADIIQGPPAGPFMVSYATANQSVSVDLRSSTATGAEIGTDILGTTRVTGGAGNDTFFAGNAGSFFFGGLGNDTFTGGSGADRFTGGAGTNSMTGGLGADVFCAFTGGATANEVCTVADFENGTDKLGIARAAFADFAAVQAAAVAAGGGTGIAISKAGFGSLTVQGLTLATFDAGDLTFI